MRFTSKSQTTTNSLKQLIEGSYTSLWIELESKKQNWKEILLEVNWKDLHMFMTYGQSWVARQPLQLVSKETWWLNLKALVGKLPCIMSRIKCFDIFSVPLFRNRRRRKKKKKKLVFEMHFADVYGKCLNTSLVNWLYQSYRGLWMKIVHRKKKKRDIAIWFKHISAKAQHLDRI